MNLTLHSHCFDTQEEEEEAEVAETVTVAAMAAAQTDHSAHGERLTCIPILSLSTALTRLQPETLNARSR